MICNARLNLLILHPFPAPSQLPQQTGAQWPIYAEVPRNKNIYLQKGGGAGRKERDIVSAHMSPALDSLGGRERGGCSNVDRASSHPNPGPHPLCKPLSTSIIHPCISQQTKHVMPPPPILNCTSSHTHRRCKSKS